MPALWRPNRCAEQTPHRGLLQTNRRKVVRDNEPNVPGADQLQPPIERRFVRHVKGEEVPKLDGPELCEPALPDGSGEPATT